MKVTKPSLDYYLDSYSHLKILQKKKEKKKALIRTKRYKNVIYQIVFIQK